MSANESLGDSNGGSGNGPSDTPTTESTTTNSSHYFTFTFTPIFFVVPPNGFQPSTPGGDSPGVPVTSPGANATAAASDSTSPHAVPPLPAQGANPTNTTGSNPNLNEFFGNLLANYMTSILSGTPFVFAAPGWQTGPNGESQQGQPPASDKAMKDLPVISQRDVAADATCTVCLDELAALKPNESIDVRVAAAPSADGEPLRAPKSPRLEAVRSMPCSHSFHETCLFAWLKSSATCPTCRYEIETDNADWNAAARRRNKDRAEQAKRAREMREAHEAHRRRSRKNLSSDGQHQCGLHPVGCCEYDEDGDAQTGPCHMLRLRCSHRFHNNCLVTNMRVRGHNLPTVDQTSSTNDSSTAIEVVCPTCRNVTNLKLTDLLHLNGADGDYNQEEELTPSKVEKTSDFTPSTVSSVGAINSGLPSGRSTSLTLLSEILPDLDLD